MHRDAGTYLPARLALLPAALYDVFHLTQRPDDFAQSSDNRVGSLMDALSTVPKTPTSVGGRRKTGNGERLFVAQRNERIDAGGAAGGQ